jgi:hypothetical protein
LVAAKGRLHKRKREREIKIHSFCKIEGYPFFEILLENPILESFYKNGERKIGFIILFWLLRERGRGYDQKSQLLIN